MRRYTSALVFLLAVFFTASAQIGGPREKHDIKAVAAAGQLNGNKYTNSYFGVTVLVPEPNTFLKINTLLAENRAILLEASNSKGLVEQRHNFAIVAHSVDTPNSTSAEEFVRKVRLALEREGLQTTRAEIPVKIGSRVFIESDLKRDAGDEHYCKAVAVTIIKGYAFGFWVEAANQEQLKRLTSLVNLVQF